MDSLEYMKELRYEKSDHIPVWKKGLCDNDTYAAHLTSYWSKLSQRERAGIDTPPLTAPPRLLSLIFGGSEEVILKNHCFV